ncbi:flagellar biosynthesis protein FliQ, partial [Aduncisulcus paluster]
MTPEMFVELFREALWMVLIMVCAIIIPNVKLLTSFDRDFVSFDAVWSLDDPNADGIFLRLD